MDTFGGIRVSENSDGERWKKKDAEETPGTDCGRPISTNYTRTSRRKGRQELLMQTSLRLIILIKEVDVNLQLKI